MIMAKMKFVRVLGFTNYIQPDVVRYCSSHPLCHKWPVRIARTPKVTSKNFLLTGNQVTVTHGNGSYSSFTLRGCLLHLLPNKTSVIPFSVSVYTDHTLCDALF